jgi:predicted permease
VFESVSLYSGGGVLQTEARGVPGNAGIEAVTPGFHEALGLRPFLGRFFSAADAPAGSLGSPVVVISHSFWQRHYDSDPNVVGERLTIENVPMTVIGVTPAEFKGLHPDGGFGFSVPLSILDHLVSADPGRPVRGRNAVARLKAGVSMSQARAAVEALWPVLRVETVPPGLSQTATKEMGSQKIELESVARGISPLRARYEIPLVALASMTLLLLVIGCVNLSGLLLGRTAERERELAVCFALGASRRHVIQQLLVETMVLSLIGTAVAVPVAWWVTRAAGNVIWQGSVPLEKSLAPDGFVLTITALVAIATGLMVGILPAWRAIQSRTQWALQPVRTVTRASGRTSKAVLVIQVALSMVLLVASGLFISSLRNLRKVDVGVQSDGLIWSRVFSNAGTNMGQVDIAYYPELLRRVSEIPGVSAVALSSAFPAYFNLGHLISRIAISPSSADASHHSVEGMLDHLSPQFFTTMRIPLMRGRDFTWQDDEKHPGVTIIDEALAERLFPSGDALGQRIRIGSDPAHAALEVIGIVRNVTVGDLREPHLPVAFRPKMQEPQYFSGSVMTFRTAGHAVTVESEVARVIRSLGHEYPRGFVSLDEHINRSLIQERLLAGVSSFFAVLALLLALLGLHGLLAYSVARRTREIGIRIALGAPRGGVVRMILGEGLMLTMIGVAIGIPSALAAGRITRSLLFGLAPSDPWTVGGAALFFLAIGATAGVWPALRASAVDPIVALRAD